MIQIKPINDTYPCPECYSTKTAVNEVVVQGMHVFADCTCNHCNLDFYKMLPIGHPEGYELSINKTTGKLYNNESCGWLNDYLQNYLHSISSDDVHIRKIIYNESKRVVIINTLDFLYGHCLLKLYNSQYHLDYHSDLGLIVLVPRNFEWLVPSGCAEAWIVDLKLNDYIYGYSSIEKQITMEFERFEEIYFSKAYSHPDYTKIDIKRFIGIEPFDLSKFYHQDFVITFILREDRFWLENYFAKIFQAVCRRLGLLNWSRCVLIRRQEALVKSTIKAIRKDLPEASYYIAGLGRSGGFEGYAVDKRHDNIDSKTERDWCLLYSLSQVVIGVHGSNMLLPTALAASCVEILPEDRFGNIVQDISVRYSDRRQLFMYRFADQFIKPRKIAQKVVAIIRDYDTFYKCMCEYIYK